MGQEDIRYTDIKGLSHYVAVEKIHGKFIPKYFAQMVLETTEVYTWENLSWNDIDILVQGPEHKDYWNSWFNILGANHGPFTIHISDHVWMVNKNKLSKKKYKKMFGSSYIH